MSTVPKPEDVRLPKLLQNIQNGNLGIEFDAKFPGMRKLQDFIVYDDRADPAFVIQSKNRVGDIHRVTGAVRLTATLGPYPVLPFRVLAKPIGTLHPEDLEALNELAKVRGSGYIG